MARPSQNLDRKLTRLGRQHLAQRGSARFSVRELCAEAGVNLGMFHYHFRTKGAFIGGLLESIYGPMFSRLNLAAAAGADPVRRLRSTLLVFGGWVCEHRRLLARLTADLLAGDSAVAAFVRTAEPRHLALISALIVECQQAGRFAAGDPAELLIFIGGSCFLPLMVGTLAEGNRLLPAPLRTVFKKDGALFTEAALERRIDAALRGLTLPHTNHDHAK